MKRLFFLLFLLLIIFLIYLSSEKYIEYQIFKSYGVKGKVVFLEIKRGMGLKNSAELMRKNGVIKKEIFFLLGHLIFFKGKTIKAGEYKFELPVSTYEVLRKIVNGEVFLHSVTIPEGSSIEDIGEILEKENLVDKKDFKRACKNSELVADFKINPPDLEGFLFPDTYFFQKGIEPEKIIEVMVRRFKEKTREYIKLAESAGYDFYKVVILASLIEKETGIPSERPLISSVFHNRLRKGIPLQCDPTVIYAMKKEGRFFAPLKGEDLSFPSPYNTYIHKGLPPGPICNPGIHSIESALNPSKTNYLYFVSNGDGTHTFSSDLSSHNRAVRNYKRKIKDGHL